MLRRPCRRGAAGRGQAVEPPALCRGDRRRAPIRPRRRRHEGRDSLLHRRRARLRQEQRPRARRLDLAAHHRRRGRSGHQRHAQGAGLDEGARRAARPLSGRRAHQRQAHRRGDQDRPARQPERLAEGDRRARPRRLSASRQQPGQGPGQDPVALLRRAARLRQRPFLAVQPRSDQHRRRQSHHQRDPGLGRGAGSMSATTTGTRPMR